MLLRWSIPSILGSKKPAAHNPKSYTLREAYQEQLFSRKADEHSPNETRCNNYQADSLSLSRLIFVDGPGKNHTSTCCSGEDEETEDETFQSRPHSVEAPLCRGIF
jgi:hypothetical protein